DLLEGRARRISRLQAYLLQRLGLAVEPGRGTVGAGLAGEILGASCPPHQSPAGLPPTAASVCRGAWVGHCRSRPAGDLLEGRARRINRLQAGSYSGLVLPCNLGEAL